MIDLSADQKRALMALMDWFEDDQKQPFITMGGFAGTGKTTLISLLRQKLHQKDKKIRVAFCSFTGKATRVLKSKLIEAESIHSQDTVGTIHSLIYSPIINDKKEITGWKTKEEIELDLLIIDEASMVDEKIWSDLLSYRIPIIAVGDHGQLPPIRGSFNLMEHPLIKLNEIHRQARNNPIIELSILARESGKISIGVFGNGVKKVARNQPESGEEVEEILKRYLSDTLILCGYNSTRIKLNQFIRGNLERNPFIPEPGDRVICLRNNHSKGIYNGMLGTVISLEAKNENYYDAEIKMDGESDNFVGPISNKQFNLTEPLNFGPRRSTTLKIDLFDYGYALTVHKAQGSQAKKVILFEERFPKMDEEMWRKWLYTGITRAEEELLLVG